MKQVKINEEVLKSVQDGARQGAEMREYLALAAKSLRGMAESIDVVREWSEASATLRKCAEGVDKMSDSAAPVVEQLDRIVTDAVSLRDRGVLPN